ncbi:MAG: hypothetical protein WCI38_02185 [Chthoniobacterales bacterium]|jgi:hypothetical protein
MVFRALTVAILFAAPAAAQQQEQGMMDRIMNPNRDRANPMGEKAFSSSPFAASEFRGSREYGGVKSAQTKEYRTRVFLGVRNPWFGRRVYETKAAQELNRYVLSDKDYASRSVETKAARDAQKSAPKFEGSVDTRDFLARGKSQGALNNNYPSGSALSIDEVRELLNRNR